MKVIWPLRWYYLTSGNLIPSALDGGSGVCVRGGGGGDGALTGCWESENTNLI